MARRAAQPVSLANVPSDLRSRVIDLVRGRGYKRLAEPVRLASGQLSYDYVDGKRALAHGDALRLAAEAAVEAVGADFDAVGGLTMGADPLAHAIAVVASKLWFAVRKEPKGRGLDKWIEGADLTAEHRVLLVDDVISTGGSIKQAYERVIERGAQVVGVVTLLDRGDIARPWFEERSVAFHPLVTYRDLGIEPVGPAVSPAAS